jgi:hypothetical protein
MPVLHKYKDKEKYYVLTSISGLLEMNNIQKTDKSLTEYRKLLDTEFINRWEEIAKTNTSKQAKKQDK